MLRQRVAPSRVAVKDVNVAVVKEAAEELRRDFQLALFNADEERKERLVVREERFRDGETPRLIDIIPLRSPTHITEPGRNDVTGHLVDVRGVEVGQRHRVRAVDIADKAVSAREIDF